MNPNTSRTITGLSITLLGAIYLLSNFNVLSFGSLISNWWPLTIIGAGVLMYINDTKNYIWASAIILAGMFFQLNELDMIDVNPWQLFWPLIIIAVGVSVMLNRSASGKIASKSERDDISAILGGTEQKNTSDNYMGGKVTAVLGGVKIDLRKATIQDTATIDVFSFWGGIEIVAPRNLSIKCQANVILGGVDDKTDQETTKDSPVLYITGDVIMAGIEIKN